MVVPQSDKLTHNKDGGTEHVFTAMQALVFLETLIGVRIVPTMINFQNCGTN